MPLTFPSAPPEQETETTSAEPVAVPADGVSESILCVDDDPNVLAALQRQFRKRFKVETAAGPHEALAMLSTKGPFAVVISDLRMPGLNGIQFLAAVRAQSPDTVRIMLTGQADFADAIAAVNQGHIFRFLLKPSSSNILGKVIEAALEQHRLIVSERQLTRQTLVGCVDLLTEILGIVQPAASSRANRVLRYVRYLNSILDRPPSWQLESAAMLSQLGSIALPASIAAKLEAGETLSLEESRCHHQHPASAARMIARIPRLEPVARIIEAHLAAVETPDGGAPRDEIHFHAAILQAAIDFDERRCRGLSHTAALVDMRVSAGLYHDQVLAALARVEEAEMAEQRRVVDLFHLTSGMILEENICSQSGMCLIGKGQQVTDVALERLLGMSQSIDPELQVSVRVPVSREAGL